MSSLPPSFSMASMQALGIGWVDDGDGAGPFVGAAARHSCPKGWGRRAPVIGMGAPARDGGLVGSAARQARKGSVLARFVAGHVIALSWGRTRTRPYRSMGPRAGSVACRLVRQRLFEIWPDLSRQAVLGVGFASPYPAGPGVGRRRAVSRHPRCRSAWRRWPTVAANLACVVDEESLPVSRPVVRPRPARARAPKWAESPRAVLREVWRVLKDDGRLLVVTPNRIGLWALVESTPFGHGQPYSSGQIGRLLTAQSFRVERREHALYLPPTRLRLILRGAPVWERVGRAALPQLGGVTITEAIKDSYAAMPILRGHTPPSPTGRGRRRPFSGPRRPERPDCQGRTAASGRSATAIPASAAERRAPVPEEDGSRRPGWDRGGSRRHRRNSAVRDGGPNSRPGGFGLPR